MESLTAEDIDRIVRMAWEDRTSFDVIQKQFGLNHGEVVRLMRRTLDPSAFRAWRIRSKDGSHLKHEKKGPKRSPVFKSRMQRLDGTTKNDFKRRKG